MNEKGQNKQPEMELEKKNKIVDKISILILVIFLIYAGTSYLIRKEKFESSDVKKHETIGIIVKWNAGSKTPNDFIYQFEVNNKTYESMHLINSSLRLESVEKQKKYIGKKFKVLYVVEDPSYSKLLLDKPINSDVPDTNK